MDPLGPLRAVCLLTGALLHVAPLPVMREIINTRSTLNYHVAPYASTLLNHTINGYYAVVRGDGALQLHRAAGIIANAAYVYIYMRAVAPGKAADANRFLLRVAGLFVAMIAWLHVALPMLGMTESSFFNHLALFAALTGIGLAASPLATVGEVIRHRDSSSLPATLCLMVTVQCSAWSVYAWMRTDMSTFANNMVGVLLGAVQLALIASCPNKRKGVGQAGHGHADEEAAALTGEDHTQVADAKETKE